MERCIHGHEYVECFDCTEAQIEQESNYQRDHNDKPAEPVRSKSQMKRIEAQKNEHSKGCLGQVERFGYCRHDQPEPVRDEREELVELIDAHWRDTPEVLAGAILKVYELRRRKR